MKLSYCLIKIKYKWTSFLKSLGIFYYLSNRKHRSYSNQTYLEFLSKYNSNKLILACLDKKLNKVQYSFALEYLGNNSRNLNALPLFIVSLVESESSMVVEGSLIGLHLFLINTKPNKIPSEILAFILEVIDSIDKNNKCRFGNSNITIELLNDFIPNLKEQIVNLQAGVAQR